MSSAASSPMGGSTSEASTSGAPTSATADTKVSSKPVPFDLALSRNGKRLLAPGTKRADGTKFPFRQPSVFNEKGVMGSLWYYDDETYEMTFWCKSDVSRCWRLVVNEREEKNKSYEKLIRGLDEDQDGPVKRSFELKLQANGDLSININVLVCISGELSGDKQNIPISSTEWLVPKADSKFGWEGMVEQLARSTFGGVNAVDRDSEDDDSGKKGKGSKGDSTVKRLARLLAMKSALEL